MCMSLSRLTCQLLVPAFCYLLSSQYTIAFMYETTYLHIRHDSEVVCCMLQKRGLAATGILAGMSKAAGFSSVSDLLQKNPDAKRPPSASLDPSQPVVWSR